MTNNKSTGKRFLAILLCVVMIVPTMSGAFGVLPSFLNDMVADVPVEADAATADDVTVYVPETIYLAPSTGNMGSFQYFVNNCDSTGAYTVEALASQTTGYVYFQCADATEISVKLTGVSAATGTLTSGQSLTNGTVLSVTSGTLSSAIAAGTSTEVSWEFSYKVNGKPRSFTAYSTVYAPLAGANSTLAATANAGYTSGSLTSNRRFCCVTTSWIVGIHSITSSQYYGSEYDDKGTAMDPPLTDSTVTTDFAGWEYASDAQKHPLADGTGANCFAKSDEDATCYGGSGVLYVDESRYKNFNQIPNLIVGLDVNHQDGWSDADLAEKTCRKLSATFGNGKDSTTLSLVNENGKGTCPEGHRDSSVLNKQIDTSVDAALILSGQGAGATKGSRNSYTYVQLAFTYTNKEALRTTVLSAYDYLNMAERYTATSVEKVQSALQSASLTLGKPDATADAISSANAALTNALNALETTIYFDASTNGGTTSATSMTVTVGTNTSGTLGTADVSGKTASKTDFEFCGWAAASDGISTGSYSKTSVSVTSFNQTFYAIYSRRVEADFIYLDANGGQQTATEFIMIYNNATSGSFGVCSSQPASVTVDGILYTFQGWLKDSTAATVTGTVGKSAEVTVSMTDVKPVYYAVYVRSNIFTLSYKANKPENCTGSVSNVPGSDGAKNSYVNVNDITVVGTTSFGIPNQEPTLAGYTFTGWNTNKDGTGTSYRYGTDNNAIAINTNTTLYAQWSANDQYLTINHYRMDTDGSGYTLTTETKDTKTGVTFNAEDLAVAQTGFGYDQATVGSKTVESVTVGASGATINLYYNRNKWTLSVNTDGSGVSNASGGGVKYFGQTATASVTLAPGYQLQWQKDGVNDGDVVKNNTASAQTQTYTITSMPDKSVTLTAVGSLIGYTITYDYNGGSVEKAGGNSYDIGTNATLPVLTKDGYVFDGWKVSQTDGGAEKAGWGATVDKDVKAVGSGKTGDVTLTAQWTAEKYNITFDTDGGSPVTDIKGYTVASNDTLPATTKAGYQFAGWTVVADAGSWKTTDSAYAEGTSVNGKYGTVQLKATWTAFTYTLIFDGNSGTPDKASLEYTAADADKKMPSASRPGYKLNGWKATEVHADAADTNGACYWTLNDTYSAGMLLSGKYGHATLQAQWKANTYSLTNSLTHLTSDGKTGKVLTKDADNYTATLTAATGYRLPETITVTCGETTLTTSDYTYDSTTGVLTIYSSAFNENITVTAAGVPVEYTIEYKLNDGIVDGTGNPGTYTIESEKITLAEPTREGYRFLGWTGSNGTKPAKTVEIAKGSTGIKNYTANWSKIYTVTLLGVDGLSPIEYIEEEGVTIQSASKDGYVFRNWKVTATEDASWTMGAAINPGTVTGVKGNVTLTAVMDAAKDYTVQVYYMGTDGTYGDTETKTVSGKYVNDSVTLTGTEYDKTGFTFDAENTGNVMTGTITADGLELKLYYSRNKYTLTTTCGTNVASLVASSARGNTDNSFYYEEEVTLTAAFNNGYEFNKWTVSGLTLVAGTPATFNMPAENKSIEVYAKKSTYTVTFDMNDKTPEGTHSSCTSIEATTYTITDGLTLPAPERVGYTFNGWKLDSDSGSWTAGTYAAKKYSECYGSLNLVAQWQAKTVDYKVNLKMQKVDKSGYDTTTKTESGQTDTTVIAPPVIDGFTCVDSASTELINGDGTTEITYTYDRNSYALKVVFDGDVKYNDKVVYGAAMPTIEYSESKTGYKFNNWTNSQDSTSGMPATMPAYDVTYTAGFTPISGKISYEVGDGTLDTDSPTGYDIENPVTLKGATLYGAEFDGWTVSNSTVWTAKKVNRGFVTNNLYGDVTLTANWNYLDTDYILHIEQQDVNGSYAQLGEDKTVNAKTADIITLDTLTELFPEKDGFTRVLEEESYKVAYHQGDEKATVVTAKYVRDTVGVTVGKSGNGIDKVTGTGKYYYEKKITLTADVKPGYGVEWFVDDVSVGKTDNDTAAVKTLSYELTVGKTDMKVEARSYLIEYTITFETEGDAIDPIKYTVETEKFTLPVTTYNDAKFSYWACTKSGAANWTQSNYPAQSNVSGKYGNVTLTAVWDNLKIKYSIEEYCENLDGEYEKTGEKTGEAQSGEIVNETLADKDGFTANAEKSVNLTGCLVSSKLVVKKYYDRNSYQVTVKPDLSGCVDKSVITMTEIDGSYKYGQEISVSASVAEHYDLTWTGTSETGNAFTFTVPAGNTEITAVVKPTAYTISYDYNGFGTNETVSYTVEETVTVKKPEYPGYTFSGWTVTVGDSNWETSYDGAEELTGKYGDVTLKANWTANEAEYTVKIWIQNADTGVDEVFYEKEITAHTDDKVTFDPETVEEFIKYADKAYIVLDTDNSLLESTVKYDDSTVLFARYIRPENEITVLDNGGGTTKITINGEETTKKTFRYGAKVTIAVELKDYYKLDNWSGTTSTDCSFEYTMGKKAITFVANTSPEIYYLTYDENGGTSVLDGHYTINDAVTVPETKRTGYILTGWKVTKTDVPAEVTEEAEIAKLNNWTDITFEDGATTKKFEKGEMHGTVTLTAQWKPIETYYTVETYKLGIDGDYKLDKSEKIGLNAEGKPDGTVYHDQKVSTTADEIDGFTFVPSKSILDATVLYNGTTVLRKYYSRNQYTLSVKNNGNGAKDITGAGKYYFGEEVTFTFALKDHCTLTDVTVGEEKLTVDGNTFKFTVPAKDTEISINTLGDEYTITFDVNGGDALESMTYRAGTTFTVPEPTKTGYSFTGWTVNNLNEDNNWTEAKIDAGSYADRFGNVALTATWKANNASYKVNVYYMDVDGTTYTLDSAKSETIASATGLEVTADTAKYDKTGFSVNAEESTLTGTVKHDNTLELSVYYARNSHSLTLASSGNGVEALNGAGTYLYGQTVTVTATVKDHYELTAWNGSKKTAASFDLTMGDSDVTLTAVTAPVKYTITYDVDGVQTAVNYTIEDTVTIKTLGLKTGYKFDGWTVTGDDSNWNDSYDGAEELTGMYGNVTLTAKWKAVPATYTKTILVMDLNGEYQTESSEVIDVKEEEINTEITVTPDERTGFTVAADSVLTRPAGADNSFAVTVKYERNKHFVTVNTEGNGASDVTGQGEYYFGATVNVGFTLKANYDFIGWTGTTETGKSFSFTMDDEAKTFTIKTSPTKYTIDYDADGGASIDAVEYTIEDNLTIAAPTRLGYTFNGWKVTGTDSNWDATVNADEKLSGKYGNVTLKADWTVNKYTITYNFKDGTPSDGYTTEYTVDDAITLPTVTKDTFVFGGWKVKGDAESNWGKTLDTTTAIGKGKVGNVTLEAIINPTQLAINVSHKVKNPSTGTFSIFNMTNPTLKLDSDVVISDLVDSDTAYVFAYAVINDVTYSNVTDTFHVSASGSDKITIYYTYKPLTLNITYKYEDDTEAAPAYTKTLYKGNNYLVYSPAITGYVPSIECVNGKIASSDLSFDVVYTPAVYTVTIHYRYNNGKVAFPTETYDYTYGNGYNILITNSVKGYEADYETIEGDATSAKDMVYTVVYSPKTYKVTVNYLSDETGKPVADTVEKNVIFGAKYSVVSPTVTGYTVAADYTRVNGTMGAEDVTVDVMYSRNANVVRFYDGFGNLLSEQSVKYGDAAVAPENPTIPDDDTYSYTFKGWDTKFTSIKADTDITAVYTKTRLDNGETINTDKTMWQKFIEFFKRIILFFSILSIVR